MESLGAWSEELAKWSSESMKLGEPVQNSPVLGS